MTTPSRQAAMAAVGLAAQVYQRSTDLLDDVVADWLDINRADLRCLDSLSTGPKSVGELSEAVALSSAAMTSLLDRLERKGLVRRVRDTRDRRKVRVEMTGRGQTEVAQLYGPLVAEGSVLLERYSDDELAMVRDFFALCTDLNERHRARIARQLRERGSDGRSDRQ
jgi:DNA-binding MarR family transcriptional regulator